MLLSNLHQLTINLIILSLALLIDLIFGEPPEKLHPTVWIGKIISILERRLRSRSTRVEKVNGILLAIIVIAIFSVATWVILYLVRSSLGEIAYMIVSAIILKTTFAIKSMEEHATLIAASLERGNINEARELVSRIVSRDTSKLDIQHILSAAVESIAESTVDGITSPLFYFSVFGVPGAVAFRAINTLDSMVGYKDPYYINIGWASAKLDTLANYIPARVTAVLIVLAAKLSGEDWRNAWKILLRDKNKTESLNAGWPMSCMAGALDVQLEKIGHYKLGDKLNKLTSRQIYRALNTMKLTTILFIIFMFIPLSILLNEWYKMVLA